MDRTFWEFVYVYRRIAKKRRGVIEKKWLAKISTAGSTS